jgi:hypothetical protein
MQWPIFEIVSMYHVIYNLCIIHNSTMLRGIAFCSVVVALYGQGFPFCSVCGKDKVVGNNDAIFNPPTEDPPLSCGSLELAGVGGYITEEECTALSSVIVEICECKEGTLTAAPVSSPTNAPTMKPTRKRTLKPTKKPVLIPTRKPTRARVPTRIPLRA